MRMYSLFRATHFRALGSQPRNFRHCNTCLHTRFCTQLRSCITFFGFCPTDIDIVHNASKGAPARGCYAVRPFVRSLAYTTFTDNNSFERPEVSPYSSLWYQFRTLLIEILLVSTLVPGSFVVFDALVLGLSFIAIRRKYGLFNVRDLGNLHTLILEHGTSILSRKSIPPY